MIMMPQKKKISTIIMGKLAGKPAGDSADFIQKFGEESDDEKEMEIPSDEMLSAEDAAMKSFLRALERKDAKGMASAMKDFMYLCEESEDSMEME